MDFLIRHIDIQYGDRYYIIPFRTLAGFIVAIVVLVVIWYAGLRLTHAAHFRQLDEFLSRSYVEKPLFHMSAAEITLNRIGFTDES
jgi:hypothetical protein